MRTIEMNVLTLAYLGDAIYEIYIRKYLVAKGIVKVNDLQKNAVNYVSAKSQSKFLQTMLDNNFFTEEEVRLFKRGRNCKGHSVKNKSVVVHNQSSGFESMVGHLYLTKQTERLDEIYELFKKYVEEEEVTK